MIAAVMERCAGIDVHKKFVMVCVLIGPADSNPTPQIRRFSTFNAELERLRAWLLELQCNRVAIGIGGAVTRSPLPHHRTYGSVYGDSVSKPARAWRFLRLNR